MLNRKVSVIVPVYNVEKYLRKCIESILSQTYSNIELLLIDDGSKDSSGQICDEFASKDTRVKVIHKQNGGVSSARNLGIEKATGDYIGFVDSDDFISPEMYRVLVEMIEETQVDIAICGYLKEVSPGEYKRYWEEDVECILSQQEQLNNLLTNRFYSCSCCDKLFRKELITALRFDEKIKQYEDMLFMFQAMKKSEKAAYISEPYYYYRTNMGSASTAAFNDSMMGIIDVSETITDEVAAKYPEIKKVAKREFVRNNIMCMQNAAKSGYKNRKEISRMQKNIRINIGWYLSSDASVGYKMHAVVTLFGWNAYAMFVRWYGRIKS